MQVGFVEAVIEYIKSGQLPPSAINDVVFEPEAASRLPEKADWGYLDPRILEIDGRLVSQAEL